MLFRDSIVRGNLESRLNVRYPYQDWVYFKAAVLSEIYKLFDKYDVDYKTEFNTECSDTAWLVDECNNPNEDIYSYLPRALSEDDKDKAVEFIMQLTTRAFRYVERLDFTDVTVIIYPNSGFRLW